MTEIVHIKQTSSTIVLVGLGNSDQLVGRLKHRPGEGREDSRCVNDSHGRRQRLVCLKQDAKKEGCVKRRESLEQNGCSQCEVHGAWTNRIGPHCTWSHLVDTRPKCNPASGYVPRRYITAQREEFSSTDWRDDIGWSICRNIGQISFRFGSRATTEEDRRTFYSYRDVHKACAIAVERPPRPAPTSTCCELHTPFQPQFFFERTAVHTVPSFSPHPPSKRWSDRNILKSISDHLTGNHD